MRARTGTASSRCTAARLDRSERARALKRLVKFGEERVRERIRDEPDRPSPDRR